MPSPPERKDSKKTKDTKVSQFIVKEALQEHQALSKEEQKEATYRAKCIEDEAKGFSRVIELMMK
jgi:hypothetical protein